MRLTRSPACARRGTIAELATAGQITFRCFEVTCRKRLGERRTRMCYSADLPDGTGWEIGKTAYMSRTGKSVFDT